MMAFKRPEKTFLIQKPMLRVCWALAPLAAASIYLFGWRSLVMLAVVMVCGIAAEAMFTFRRNQPVTSAVFVTCLIFHLSLPPTLPFWMAAVGIVAGIVFGKMVFGGFGQNVFNPAMVGRCFIYITFPVEMTNVWAVPAEWPMGALMQWAPTADAVTRATPLYAMRRGEAADLLELFLGNTSGSIGETSALLCILGGAYIIYRKAASWRLALSCLIGGAATSGLFNLAGFQQIPSPLATLLAGSFLFGAFFVVTEPISGPKTKEAQWVYGLIIGGLTVILRGFSNFSEGVMFAVLLMNSFAPLLDDAVKQVQSARKQKAAA